MTAPARSALALAMRVSALTGYALSVSYDFVRWNRVGAERLLAFATRPIGPPVNLYGDAYRKIVGGGW